MKKKVLWINVLRGIAIIAVIVDHSFIYFPWARLQYLWPYTYFMINWFIFLSGVTNALSRSREKWRFPTSYFIFYKKKISIFIVYLIASIVYYYLYINHNLISSDFVTKTINFSVSKHFYFISIIMQLYLLFPVLYGLQKKIKNNWLLVLIAVLIAFLCYAVFPVNKPLWEYKLYEGFSARAYLPVFFLGVLYAKKKPLFNIFQLMLIACVFVLLQMVILQDTSIFINIIPNFLLAVWSMSLLFIVKNIISKINKNNFLVKVFDFIGQYSLFIYLYHLIFYRMLKNIVIFPIKLFNYFFTLLLVIIFPIIIGFIFKKGKTILLK